MEAATIDGCNFFQVWYKIMMPLAKPAVATIVIFTFINSWGEFMFARTLSSTPAAQTLAVGITFLRDEAASWQYGTLPVRDDHPVARAAPPHFPEHAEVLHQGDHGRRPQGYRGGSNSDTRGVRTPEIFKEAGYMKKILCLTLALVLSIGMAAVAGGKKEAAPNSQGKEEAKELRLVAQAWMLGKYKIEEAARIFEKDHPRRVKVVISKVDNADTTTNMLQWAQGKTNSDLALGGSQGTGGPVRGQGLHHQFRQGLLRRQDQEGRLLPRPSSSSATSRGPSYMIPITGEVMFIVVNKTLMKKAGLVDASGKGPGPEDLGRAL